MPSTSEALMQLISNEVPHICHFFCHGTADQQAQLEIGHLGTVEGGDAPLYLEPHHLGQLANSAWLMVLNACETAHEVGGARPNAGPGPARRDGSFATALVEAGIPYVLGMRQKISSSIVPIFTFGFYDAIFDQLSQCIAPSGRCLVDLDPALIRGQDAICRYFGNPREVCEQYQDWSLPILYTQRKRFFVASVKSEAVGGYGAAVHLLAERAKLIETHAKVVKQGIELPGVLEGIDRRVIEIETQLGSA